MQVHELLFAWLSVALCGKQPTEQMMSDSGEDTLLALYRLAAKHDVAHLVGTALSKHGMLGEGEAVVKFQKKCMTAVFRYEGLRYELFEVCRVLEAEKISFMPLKGSVLRDLYPEPWMRTSCDIDILVRNEDLKRAIDGLKAELGYTEHEQNEHDVSLFSPSGVHVELHYDLMEDGLFREASEVLREVWRVASLKEGYSYHYEMTDERFYFYHIAHMAKHFENGGCGIRPFIDLWFLDKTSADTEKRDALLKRGGLYRFAECARALRGVWLDGNAHDDVTRDMERYIISGGVYGSHENRIAVQQQKKGGKLRYALSKIFVSYDTLKCQYPVLQRHAFLMPFMQVRRWCRILFCGGAGRSVRELSYSGGITKAEAASVKEFLEQIGL
jgi:hypothetical protein